MNEENLRRLELAATKLRKLNHEVVFVGGATVELWITDPAAPPFRPTDDIDVTIEVSSLAEYHDLERDLRSIGLRNDTESGVICRFIDPDSDLVLDVLPTQAAILGFGNRWLREAFGSSRKYQLPSGESIQILSPPLLLASKIEAFQGRGDNDFYGSRDFEDIVRLVDGRPSLISELQGSSLKLRDYISEAITAMRKHDRFENGVEGALPMGLETYERTHAVLLPRFNLIARLSP